MLKQSNIKAGFLLCVITLILFFSLYLLYTNFTFISHRQYFVYSSIIICFVLPILYTGFGISQIIKQARKKAQTFREGFRLSFLTLVIGGFCSAIIIFVFFNTLGVWAQENLKIEWLDAQQELIQASDAETDEKNNRLEDIDLMRNKEGNMFSFMNFIKFILLLTFFYIAISAILAMFMKNRTI